MDLSEQFWNDKYQTKITGWDIGEISSPLKHYFNQLENKHLKILIPGAGNAYEAEYLYNLGFKNVYILDISKTALTNFASRVPHFPKTQLLHSDFFHYQGNFDLIIEQTFFCAIHPSLRKHYALKTSQLLNNGGKLVGLLFNAELNDSQPPFGGNKNEYLTYFSPFFHLSIFETCYNSINSRKEKELFIKLLLKS